MSWIDLYLLVHQMTTPWTKASRTCFAALVSAFLYHERFHTANAVDHLARIRHFHRRKAYRKIEKFLHRKTMDLQQLWQWLWDRYTLQIKDCFVLVDWTMWKDGRQVLLAALAHSGRCLPFLAVAYHIKEILKSQNQAEDSFFLLLSLLKHTNQQITCIKDRGFSRISLLKKMDDLKLHFITRVCHNTYFASEKYQGILRDFQIRAGQMIELGEGLLGKDKKNQIKVRLIAYLGRGHKAAWLIATDRADLTASQVVSLYARRMGIEAGFRDSKAIRYGWGLKQIGLRSDVQLSVMWAAAMVAYAIRMAAGASVVKRDEQAQFNWTKKGPRRSLLSVGRNAVSSGLLKSEELVKQLPKLALRLDDLKLVEAEKPAKICTKAAGANT